MSNNSATVFQQFAKGKKIQRIKGGHCVIYTRVSTKEQADNNMSLETQRKACEDYALKNGYEILGYFGGTYESAKTDERKHFTNMLKFVKKAKENVSTILVYSVDRFSRSGGNAIYITEELRKQGIALFAVTQPKDTNTVSGSLQQNIQFIFSEYDNQLRREKCMAGTKEKIRTGVWCGRAPMGYDIVRSDGKRTFVLNAKGKLIKKAFAWKVQGLSNEDIRVLIVKAGWNVGHQRISDFLTNPFYCGMMVHNALEGDVIEGIQEKAVSKEVFLQVNNILAQNAHGYTLKMDDEEAPLRRFIRCEICGKIMTAYKSKKIQKYYYKCRTKGCNCNKRADDLHKRFEAILESVTISAEEDILILIKQELTAQYHASHEEERITIAALENQVQDAEKKIKRLEDRFVEEEIDREMFLRYKEKFTQEREEIVKRLGEGQNKVSNLEKTIDEIINYALKLAPGWAFGGYDEKQLIQKVLFPEGFYYNREKDQVRTPRINSVFAHIASLAWVSENEKTGNFTAKSDVAGWVGAHGFEPRTLCL